MSGNPSAAQRLLRTNNVADRYHVTTRMVRYLVETGLLPATRDGIRLYRYDPAEVDQIGRRLGYIKAEA